MHLFTALGELACRGKMHEPRREMSLSPNIGNCYRPRYSTQHRRISSQGLFWPLSLSLHLIGHVCIYLYIVSRGVGSGNKQLNFHCNQPSQNGRSCPPSSCKAHAAHAQTNGQDVLKGTNLKGHPELQSGVRGHRFRNFRYFRQFLEFP